MTKVYNCINKNGWISSCLSAMPMLAATVMVWMACASVGAAADEVEVTYEGHFGGVTPAVAVSGNYAFISQGQDFIVLDINDPAIPLELSRLVTDGMIEDITVSGDYAYIAELDNGLVIVDISNKNAPVLTGSYDMAGYARGVSVLGDFAYIAGGSNGLVIVDISNKNVPVFAGSYDTAGRADGISVSGDYAYVADWNNSLVIVDISNKNAPVFAGSYDTTGYADGVSVSGDYAYVACDSNGLVIVDISNKNAPVFAGNYDMAGYARGVSVLGDFAYVADWENGLVIVDISNKNAPVLTGSYDTTGYALGVCVSGDYAYVDDWDNGLVIVDINNKNAPVFAGNYDTAGGVRGVYVSGNYAYVADGDNGLVIVNISNKNAPVFAGNYDTAGYARGVYISGDYAYVADFDNGLVIVDISNKNAPVFAGSYDTAGYAWGVCISEDYAYIADYYNGLVIVDISNKNTPVFAGSHDTAGGARGVSVSGDYAYVADYYNGLVILCFYTPTTQLPSEITRSRLGINAHWNHWAEDLSIYEQKTKNFGIVRDQAWWAGLETSDLTGSEWDHANWNYPYDTETLCSKEIKYQSGLDNLVKMYQDEDSPELLLLLNLKNDNISSFETITADQYYDYVYHVVERYDGDGQDDMPGLIRPVRYFEVGNEVDYISTGGSRHGYLSPKDYVENRLIPAYNAAKATNKDAVIMGCGLGMGSDLYGNDGQEFNTMYLNAMYDNITKNGGNKNNNFYMDKIAIHYYAKPNAEFDRNIKKVEDVIQKYENRDKPIWITEFYPLTEIGQRDTTTGAFARLLTLMFANRIEMPVIYNLKDDSESGLGLYGLYDVTCKGNEETITPKESIQVINTVLSTFHSTTPSETENENIFIEPGKTTYKRVFNNSDKKVTVLWYIDTAAPGAITDYEVSPESPQTFTVDVLGTANFSQTSPIDLEIGSEPTYVVEANLPIDVDLYFNRTTTAGVSTQRATSFAVGDTLYGKIKTSTSTDHIVKTYITITMPDGTCRYAYYDKPDFTPGIDRVLLSDKKVQLYDGVWHATTDDWLWNIYEFTGGDSGIYAWNGWYEDSETGEILGGNSTEYTFSTTPSGTPVDSSTGKGEVYLDSSAGNLENFIAVSPDDMLTMPDSLNPVYGFFSFNITGISGGQSVNIPLAFPENVPIGTEYWKHGPTPDDITPHWYQIPVSDDDGDRIIVITLTDGGIGDDDLTANSVIIDDGGPSLPLRVHNIDTGENFSTIQTAIDAPDTQDGHTITVDAGMYVENVNVYNKQLTLVGEGADMVTVQAADTEDHVFEVTADLVNISGFAVTGATGNYNAGIYLDNADRCSILENNVSENDCGIFIGDSNNNTLYHNNLINNIKNAYDNSTNQWDSGTEGNYYSDYGGIDADGDGIGDIPYNISGGAGAQDRYPLMQAWNESDTGSEFISIGSANVPPNSTVTIPVSVANVTNILGISFDLLYNSSVVTVISVSANGSFTGSSITLNIDNANGTTEIVLTNSNLISASTETPVIEIAFHITGASGSITSLDLQNVEFNDSEFNPYTPAVVVNGQITVGIKGDFNGNGRVDIGDAAKVAFMVAGKVPEDLNADFNGNGRVDIGDAAKIAFYLTGKVSEL